MPITILKTDNGPHDAKHWAVVTASHLIDVQGGPHMGDGAALTEKLVAALTEHHGNIQKSGRSALKKRQSGLDMQPHINSAMAAILAAVKGTPFAAHFDKPDVRDYMKDTLKRHFATSLDIESQWHKLRSN